MTTVHSRHPEVSFKAFLSGTDDHSRIGSASERENADCTVRQTESSASTPEEDINIASVTY